MRNRLITIFGGTGFIGRYVVRRLAQRHALIRVVSRDWAVHGRDLQPMGAVGQIVGGPLDLADEAALTQALTGSFAVINLIGILYETRRQQFDEVHARAARADRAGGAGGRRAAARADLGARRRWRLGQRLRPQQGRGRGRRCAQPSPRR